MGSVIGISVTIGEFLFSIIDILFTLRYYRHIYGTPQTDQKILYGKAILLFQFPSQS